MAALRSLAATLAATALFASVQAWHIDLPPCTAPFRPFVYSGCYADNTASGATLSFHSDAYRYNMTVETCMAECKGNGFRYAGLEYYGECYCGNTVNGPLIDESKCTYPCTGNKSEICGGSDIISIYQDTTFYPIDDTTISDYAPLGCYFDNSNIGKALSYPQSSINGASMTTEKCLAQCKLGGYPFAGLEYSQECWCGVVLGNYSYPVADSDCNMPCKGNSAETCGGRSRLSLYVSTQLESIEPCGYTPPIVSSSSSSSSVDSSTSTSTTSSVQSSTEYPTTTSDSSTSTTEQSTSSSSTQDSTTSSSTQESTTSSSTQDSTSSSSTQDSTSSSSTQESTSSSSSSSASSSSSSSSTQDSTTSSSTQSSSTSSSQPGSTTSSPSSTSTTSTTPTSTSQPTTSATPPPTTSKPTSTSTSVCYATTTVLSTCEYGCGKWCNVPLPEWNDQTSCKTAWSSCKIQVAACFLKAGWPDSMKCFDYADWCSDIRDYCAIPPSKVKGGSYGKGNCFSSNPPNGGSPATTKTVSVPCASTTSQPASSTTSKCPIPTVTNICKQPSNWLWGYDSENPVGDIDLPVVTCNDLKSDFAQKPLKLYTDSDSRKCPGYTRPQCSNACADACATQYQQCLDVYAQGCKQPSPPGGKGASNFWDSWFGSGSGKGGPRHRAVRDVKKRTGFGWGNNNYNNAVSECKAQYSDCLSVNRNVNANGKCGSFGSGW